MKKIFSTSKFSLHWDNKFGFAVAGPDVKKLPDESSLLSIEKGRYWPAFKINEKGEDRWYQMMYSDFAKQAGNT